MIDQRRQRDQRDRLRGDHQRVDAAPHARATSRSRSPGSRAQTIASAIPSSASSVVVHMAGARLARSSPARCGDQPRSRQRRGWRARRWRRGPTASTSAASRQAAGGHAAPQPRVARGRSPRRRQQRVGVERAHRRRALDQPGLGEDPLEPGVVGVGLGSPDAGAVEEMWRRRVAGRVDDLARVGERAGGCRRSGSARRRPGGARRTHSPAASAFSARASTGPRAAMSWSLAT